MTNGLNINIKEFEILPASQKLTLLYKNTEELKVMVASYKFQQKAQWLSIIFLATIFGLKDKIVSLLWN